MKQESLLPEAERRSFSSCWGFLISENERKKMEK
jgi:hypothetical protein